MPDHEPTDQSTTSSPTPPPRSLNDVLPVFQQREVHTRRYRADPDQLRDALQQLRVSDLPLTRFLFSLRRVALPGNAAALPIIDQLERAGFCRVVDQPEVITLVAIGRFWRPDGQRIHVDGLDAFRQFNEPGYAKGALEFRFTRQGESTTSVATETRVASTDTVARLLMTAYWTIIRIGSSLIRRELLAALSAETEASLAKRSDGRARVH